MGWKKNLARVLERWSVETQAPQEHAQVDGDPGHGELAGRLSEIERASARRAEEIAEGASTLRAGLHDALHQHACHLSEVENELSARAAALAARVESVAALAGSALERITQLSGETNAALDAARAVSAEHFLEAAGAQAREAATLSAAIEALSGELGPERVRLAARLAEAELDLSRRGQRFDELARELDAIQDRIIRQSVALEAARVAARRARWLAALGLLLAAAALAIASGQGWPRG